MSDDHLAVRDDPNWVECEICHGDGHLGDPDVPVYTCHNCGGDGGWLMEDWG